MTLNKPPQLVMTVRKRCRMCYTCVRECPAKAIRIADGQAKVMIERCIGCGNCIHVCSQGAKQMISTIPQVGELLNGDHTLAAIVAPSFPAEFTDIEPQTLVGMIRSLGFDLVAEVSFGADLVARAYRELLQSEARFITTSCPAVVAFIARYCPQLIDSLAPVVSPMVAMARVLRAIHGEDLRVVFIGPCIAKKGEATAVEVENEIDGVITFIELREMFMHRRVAQSQYGPSDFDPPHGRLGSLFALQGGELQAAGITEDLMNDQAISVDGHKNFVSAIRSFEAGNFHARVLDVLCCEGCVMGQGMSSSESHFTRRSRVSKYVRERVASQEEATWQEQMDRFADLDLSRIFLTRDQRIRPPSDEELADIMRAMGKHHPSDELNCGACGYETCRDHAVAIFKGLAESEMCLPYTIEKLHHTVTELHSSNALLANTQEALSHSERLASMGQLAAGIAHEVNNPLGVVLMYAHLLREQCPADSPFMADLDMIVREADRCKKIVAGLLNFARQNKVLRKQVDVVELLERCVRNVRSTSGVRILTNMQMENPYAELDADQIIQVITNLVANAHDAMPQGGTLTVSAREKGDDIAIAISDTGVGISPDNLKRVFEPFFTTKEFGKGTGLGLSMAYGIVKMHRGQITVQSNADIAHGPTGTTFLMTLPRRNTQDKAIGAGNGVMSNGAA